MTGKKVVIISDLHLTKKFSPAKFSLLKQVIEEADQLIINGDLWEGFGMTIQDFITSKWQALFPLFKQKEAIYLFGNHDEKNKDFDYRVFCDQAVTSYEFSQNGVNFFVVHGDFLDPTIDMRHPNLPRLVLNYGAMVERLLVKIIGRKYLDIYKNSNNKMKAWHKSNRKDEWLICGHSHLAEIDESNKFANSGIFLSAGLASYLKIENGKVELHYT